MNKAALAAANVTEAKLDAAKLDMTTAQVAAAALSAKSPLPEVKPKPVS